MWSKVLFLMALGFCLMGCRHPDTGGAAALREDGSLERAGRDRGYTGKAIDRF